MFLAFVDLIWKLSNAQVHSKERKPYYKSRAKGSVSIVNEVFLAHIVGRNHQRKNIKMVKQKGCPTVCNLMGN